MKKLFIRSTACLLAIMMLLSTAGCGAFNNQHDSAKGSSGVHVDPISQGNSTLTPGASTNTAVSDVQTATREELEQMLVSLSKGTFTLADAMAMSDKELKEKVQMYLDQLKGETGFTALPEGYDENGALTKPFDQLYPELVESEQVSYSKDALLLKLKNSSKGAVTKEMKAAGVVKLEAVVPMEETTWYKASLTEGTDVGDAVEALRQVKTVLMVDYDYEVKTSAIDHYKELPPDKGFENNKKHPEQWYLHHAGIPDGYKNMKNDGGSSSVVVAVIDTGVDYDHEDLAQNIWVNKGEVPDDGIDNDGNGYIDDYYGVNIITGKGNGDDDNGHGTHVAGIIAAQNNKLGIVGIAYNTKVMPIKAAMASGYLHQSDIAKAVLYAYEQGAEVINMSFGGTACSIAVQDALATAYTRCVLVASAGNDGAYNEGLGAIPNYPAALTYVLGVMSVDQDGRESYFTNWDVKAFNGVEYELYAPGNEIVSTIPGDRYATWSGTSMAAPMVSAIAAILRSEFTDRDTYPTRFIYGQLSATSEHTATCYNPQAHGDHNIPQIVNLFAALTKLPKPELGVQDSMHFDTLDGNGDGVIDAGETIELGFILRNRWGQSKDTLVTIDTLSQAGIADPYITILNDTVDYGSVGSYATGDCGKIFTDELLSGWEKPFRLKIADDCPNDYIFTLNITIRCKNGLDLEDDTTYVFGEKPYQFTIDLTVRNGTVLPAIIDEDMTLTPDHLYIIPNSTVIDEGVTVRVEPGTRIQFWSDDPDDPYADTYIPYLLVKGKFLVNGTAEDPVYIFPSDLMHNYNIEIAQSETGWVSLRHADITNFVYYITNTGYSNRIASAESCTFRFNYDLRDMNYRDLDSGKVSTHRFYSGSIGSITNANNCVFYKLGNTQSSLSLFGTFEHCAFVDCGIQFRGQYYDEGDANLRHCLLLGNHFVDQTKPNIYDNSSVTVSGKPSINVPYLYRCKENGTTYFYGPIDSFWAKKIGADYAIFETAEEWDQFTALDASRGGNYQVYTRYDVDKDRFVWADGSEIGAFADPNGAAISPKNPNGGIYIEKNYATGEHLLAYGNYGAYYYLYELKGNILPESIRFNEYEVSLDTGATYQISPISAPVQLPADRFLYECSDPSVLSVDATGKVTPLKQGTADVVVYSLDRAVKNYITFHVVDYVPLEGISLDKSELRLAVGEYAKLNCLFTPANTTRKHAIFTVADPKIASVDEGGVITPLSSGTTTVTVTCEGFTATAEIIVFVRATEFDFELPAVTYPLAEGEASLPTLTITKGAVTDIVYRSTEPGVASIANGKLILHKAGTTDIIAREQNSGLVAKITLYVTNGALSPVVDLKISGNDDFYALLANGDLYYWSYYQKKPVRIAQKVKAFDAYSAYSLVLYEDNTLAELNGNRVVKTWTDFKDRAPIDVGYNGNGGSSYYVLTENGRAYAWGRNDYGTLGVGSVAETIDRPTLVNLDAKIVDIHVSYYDTTWFVTENGSLYMAGAQNLQASAPILIAEGISAAWMEEYHLYYIDADGQLVYMEGYSESTDVRGDAPASTLITGGYGPWNNDNWSNIYLTYDNNTLTFHTGNRDTVLPTVGEVTAMAWMEYNSSTFWYATEDGMLYAFGSNRYNQFGGATTDSTSDKPVAIPLFPIVGDALTMTESNLSDTGILSED
ncbi:MAG: hypothetical protein E7599_06155, partial [Ruminococcaceae bacterium]|nr:hypothetical protein [Oscillospiraceae bacterium]